MRSALAILRALLASACLLLAARPGLAAELRVELAHTFAGQPLLLDSLRYEHAGETLSVTRLSYLLTGFAVQAEDGHWHELSGQTAWVDLAARRTSFSLTDLPSALIRAVRFHVGPDAATNAASPASFPPGHPLNPALNNLHWSWQSGFVFLAVEGRYRRADSALGGYLYHLARDPHRTAVTLALPAPAAPDATLEFAFDLAALLSRPQPISFAALGETTHSRPGDPLAAALAQNLPAAFSVLGTSAAAPAPTITGARPAPLWLPAKFRPYALTIPHTYPLPQLPLDNPLIEERVALGRRLFAETALSRQRDLSCASCHRAEAAFGDSHAVSLGTERRAGTRNAMPLFNLAWKSSYFWDGRAPSLRAQALLPIQDHRELDLDLPTALTRLHADPAYREAFAAAFSDGEITAEKIGLALEQFLLVQIAPEAKFDRAMRGEAQLTPAEQRGFELFFTEHDPRTGQRGADCFHCHGGALFSDHQFHFNGLRLTAHDTGREAITQRPADRGRFSTPSLRNLTHSAPYMHDGRFATLEAVIAHYNGPLERTAALDPNLAKHPAAGLGLSAEDCAALVAFLRTLSP